MNGKYSPWSFVSTLYLAEGLPYIIINTVSVVMYAQMGIPNDVAAFWTGWLYLPWILKMLWSPLVDATSTKRRWILGAQGLLSLLFLGLAFLCAWETLAPMLVTGKQTFFTLSLCGFLLGAFASATLDIATDGFYLLSLSPENQSRFVGIRTIFYRMAMIVGSGILVSLTGWAGIWLHGTLNWSALYISLGLLFAVFAVYHHRILPRPSMDKPASVQGSSVFKDSFKTYFTQKNIIYILLFILLYRLGDALLEKTVVPFLIKPVSEGALGLSLSQYGLIKGTLGLGAVIAGNLAGGWLLARYGFKKCIWPFALILILPNFFYAYMAYFRPPLWEITALITLEHLGNGLAMMAFMVFIMYVSQGKYKTSHYAISTGVMALGMMGPSMLSGILQVRLGYSSFFLLTSFLSLVTLTVVPLAFRIKSIEETEKHFRQHKMSLEDTE